MSSWIDGRRWSGDSVVVDATPHRSHYARATDCVADPTAGTLRHALSPLLVRDGVTITDLSRLLACAAPDRFVSIVNEPVQHRIADIVGFDLTAESRDRFDHLIRYSHAIEQIHKYPWAATPSAERSSEHVDEPDAWSKRVALLGCFVE